MKCYIALGSNLGDRRANLERAIRQLEWLRLSPIIETSALVPQGAPNEWQSLAFYNAVAEIAWNGSPRELLTRLKEIESEMGRISGPRWAPRLIDLDILTFGDLEIAEEGLQIPHPEMNKRSFVLSPLKHLAGPHTLRMSRSLGERQSPLVMGIINLTPDSFSDGGKGWPALDDWDQELVSILDLGAESTRPGATPLDEKTEWNRLCPILDLLRARYAQHIFRPWISVDTYHVETAAKAIEYGVDMINDVSGCAREEMLTLIANSQVQYVLMHSLTVPADPKVTMKSEDVVAEVKAWALYQLHRLEVAGVDLSRVLFDPGIGFGKTAVQSETLVREIHRFMDLPVRLLVGHSRKSFLRPALDRRARVNPAAGRDPETLGLSLKLADKGVDVIRVHTPDIHQRVLRRYQ